MELAFGHFRLKFNSFSIVPIGFSVSVDPFLLTIADLYREFYFTTLNLLQGLYNSLIGLACQPTSFVIGKRVPTVILI